MDLTHVRFAGTPLSPLRSGLRPGASPLSAANQLLTRPAVTGVPAAVLAHAGLDPLHYRAAPLERRTSACLRMFRSGRDSDVLSALLIGFSGFFRDADVFETLRHKVIPQLRDLERPIRVLSVGCSTGQELYSVAMLLAEHGLVTRAELVGVDCRTDAIRSARHGVFHESLVGDVPAALRSRYFTASPNGLRVHEQLRSRTHWQVMDATVGHPAGLWDLVLCRNLFIYLQPRTMHLMVARMLEHLAPQGVLVVGKAERPPAHFGLKPIGRCIYTRHAR